MASSIPKDKATGHGAWSTRRVLRKARSSHLGYVPNTSALTYPLGNHRITEGFFRSGLKVMNIIPHDLGWSCPYPRKGTWQKYAEIDSNSTCFHARILPAATFQRQKTHWCPACHQRFELRRATDPGTKILSKSVQRRSTPLSFARNWPNFCVTSTLHMISLKCSTFASTSCQDVQESDKRAMEGKGGRDQKLGWFWRAFKLSSPKSARELLWQACNLPRNTSEVTSSLHFMFSPCLSAFVYPAWFRELSASNPRGKLHGDLTAHCHRTDNLWSLLRSPITAFTCIYVV